MTLGSEHDTASLRKDLRDVVAVLSLPLMWRGRTPAQIAENLADVLVSLLRLDFLHLRVDAAASGQALEQTRQRGDPLVGLAAAVQDVQVAGDAQVDAGAGPPLRLSRVEPGVQPEHWHVIAGARRGGFPTDGERFLMRVTVDQAAVSIENARLFLEAQEASRAKSQFIATMSHELRTPLNAILGYVDLLLLGVPEHVGEPSRRHVERIRASARHLLELIDSILTFARMEAGREELHLETVDLSSLTRETAELLHPIAHRSALTLEWHVPDAPVVLDTDPAKVRQILFNLLSNAIKFTDRGGVDIRLDADADGAVVQVRDTGVGIPAAEMTRIFEPFRQVEGTLTRRTGGTGLGLSVARSLCDLMGATLEVESVPGQGSTFTLRLPTAAS